MVIDDLEFSDVLMFLHDSQEFDEHFGDRSEQNLFLSFSFCVDDGFECVSQDIAFHHFVE